MKNLNCRCLGGSGCVFCFGHGIVKQPAFPPHRLSATGGKRFLDASDGETRGLGQVVCNMARALCAVICVLVLAAPARVAEGMSRMERLQYK